jgi:hypothetical protein
VVLGPQGPPCSSAPAVGCSEVIRALVGELPTCGKSSGG